MDSIVAFINSFVTEDYFIIFFIILLMILIVLIMALIKTRRQFYDLPINDSDDDLFVSLKSDISSEELPPIDRNINMEIPKYSYDDIVSDYEASEEENAVISTEELEQKTQERMEALGVTDNQVMIQKYEEEQEKKAIISYEQLLKNASNITITYKEEETPEGSPRVNKIEVQEKEISEAQSYIAEEDFLRILKEFRMSLPR